MTEVKMTEKRKASKLASGGIKQLRGQEEGEGGSAKSPLREGEGEGVP